jgi:spore germination protein KB
MQREVIANRQLGAILFMARTTVVLSLVPSLTTGDAMQDAWASALVSAAVMLVIAWLIGALGAAYPRLTVVEYSRRLLGSVLGTAVSMVFAYCYLLIAATDIRIFAELVRAAFMPNTPMLVVITTIALTSGVVAWIGLETVGRIADMFIPFFVMFIVVSVAGAFTHFDAANLQPVLARGIKPVISSIWTLLGIGLQWTVVSMLVPSLAEPEKATAVSVTAALAAGLVSALTVAAIVGFLGPQLGSDSLFPFLKTARTIMLSRVIQRLESLGMMAWGLGLSVTGATMTYCGSRCLAQVLGVVDHRKVLPAFSVGVIAYGLLAYTDVFDLIRFFKPPGFTVRVGLLGGVPYALMWGAHLVRRAMGEGAGRDESR